MPRRYTLGKRAGPKADTRARILAAAVEIYRDRGMAAASNLAIAHGADVSPATVRNHFPDSAGLVAAVFDAVFDEIQPPGPAIFDGVVGLEARLRRLVAAMLAFYERADSWWRAYEREPALFEASANRVQRYNEELDETMRAALGPLSTDSLSLAVVAAVVGSPTFFALRSRGLSSDEAGEIGLELALPWLDARQRQLEAAQSLDLRSEVEPETHSR